MAKAYFISENDWTEIVRVAQTQFYLIVLLQAYNDTSSFIRTNLFLTVSMVDAWKYVAERVVLSNEQYWNSNLSTPKPLTTKKKKLRKIFR